MLWLAFDSSGTSGSIALEKDNRLIYQCYFNIDITHSETLMPQIDVAFKFCGLAAKDLNGIVTTIGPGSFTGLRIGLATAKGIAYARKLPLLTYSTLELVAANCYGSKLPILVCLDAKMKEFYAGLYSSDLSSLLEDCVIKPELLISQIDTSVTLVGNVSDKVKPMLEEKGLQVCSALEHQNLPMAAGLLALKRLKPQPEVYDFDMLAALEPRYLRESTAQIKFKEKQETK